VIFEPLQN